jgi:hypothetical protein
MLEELSDRHIIYTHTFAVILYLQHCFWNTRSRTSKPWEAILCRRIPPSLLLAWHWERSQSPQVVVHCVWTPSYIYCRPLCDNGSWRCGDMERDTPQDWARSVKHRPWFSWFGLLGSMLGWVSCSGCYCDTGWRSCLPGAMLVTVSSSYALYTTRLCTIELCIQSFPSYSLMFSVSCSHVPFSTRLFMVQFCYQRALPVTGHCM